MIGNGYISVLLITLNTPNPQKQVVCTMNEATVLSAIFFLTETKYIGTLVVRKNFLL